LHAVGKTRCETRPLSWLGRSSSRHITASIPQERSTGDPTTWLASLGSKGQDQGTSAILVPFLALHKHSTYFKFNRIVQKTRIPTRVCKIVVDKTALMCPPMPNYPTENAGCPLVCPSPSEMSALRLAMLRRARDVKLSHSSLVFGTDNHPPRDPAYHAQIGLKV